jgi:calpain-7
VQEAEKRIPLSSTKEEALESAILATEIYMKAIKLASSESEKTRLKTKCMRLLARAEEIKQQKVWMLPVEERDNQQNGKVMEVLLSTRTLCTREKVILLEGSKLHGLVFPQWTSAPSGVLFDSTDGVYA